ncbi:endonuclease [Phytomonospora endophytica]|nr:endonuclease [Phytomonospora endophytica]
MDRFGRTYAEQAGITLTDKPSPLYRLLVLTVLLSKPISADVAVAAARELSDAGLRTPSRTRASTWRQRVAALGRAGYRRYDASTAELLGAGAELLRDRWHDDLRELRREGGDAEGIERLLLEVPGIGPTGAAIYLREVQGAWPEVAPYVDERAAEGAEVLGLPPTPTELKALAPRGETGLVRLIAACVRVALERDPARMRAELA